MTCSTTYPPLNLLKRPRRQRLLPGIRRLTRETALTADDLVQPLFIREGIAEAEPIAALPGQFRHTLDSCLREIDHLVELGISAIALFPSIPDELKDSRGSQAFSRENIVCQAVKEIKRAFPELIIFADVALDPYTDHGHDGWIDERGIVVNDDSVRALCEMACLLADVGVDVISPSDMMDGRVKAIREVLDTCGFQEIPILSYAVKYATALYGPFRQAVGSRLIAGDKLSYQLQPNNVREALRECAIDEEEGADILLIKPALLYLDVIAKVRMNTHLPIAAFHVSGEYAMACAAAERGWLDGNKVMEEMLLSIKRAGADFIFTYAAKSYLESPR